MKFTRDGKLVMTIGQYDKNAGSNDTTLLGGPSGIWVDPKTNEVFISDGYRNRRVIVFDGATGKYLRHWGAYGEKPDDTEKFDPKTMVSGALPKQFSTPHGLTGSKDGKIYVADRRGNRIQVFDHAGQVPRGEDHRAGDAVVGIGVRHRAVARSRSSSGSTWRTARITRCGSSAASDLEVVGEFGRGGRQLGQFLRPHGMSIDSKGNLYVGEASTGRRVQKFALQRAAAK